MKAGDHRFVSSARALAEFVAAWEACALTKSEFTHAAHVAVGAYYAVMHPSTAFERMKSGLIQFNESVGGVNSETSGYHETITRLWIEVLAKFVATNGFTDPWEAACAAVTEFGEARDLHGLYYSFDVLRSVEARRRWVPPDLMAEGSGTIERIPEKKPSLC
jgi:hypothetical protein